MEIQKEIHSIDNLELVFLKTEDYEEIKSAMIESYSNMPGSYWKEHHIRALIEKFPEGQVGIKVDHPDRRCRYRYVAGVESVWQCPKFKRQKNRHLSTPETGHDVKLISLRQNVKMTHLPPVFGSFHRQEWA